MRNLFIPLACIAVVVFLSTSSVSAGPGDLECPPLSSLDAACCDPLDQPGGIDTQSCVTGFDCCADGRWRCSDADGLTTCNAGGIVGSRCCDPTLEPGMFDNPTCFEGATCCSTGEWQCNDGGGQSTCDVEGASCAPRCCDPEAEPGNGDNPPCFEGATCCASGRWQCNSGSGESTCDVDSRACEDCCDPLDEPGRFGNPTCFEGSTCCPSGEWECNDATGQPTCDVVGQSCELRCCDPLDEPGRFGNPTCFEGATCCSTGEWECNDAGGESTCLRDSRACERCCDPRDEPGEFDNPPCFEGATCCGDGSWECNDGTGQSTCGVDGAVCDPPCCDRDDRPNELDTSVCASGFECCADGTWRCNSADGISTCEDGLGEECPTVCGGIAGLPCDDDEFCKLRVGECCCDQLGICVEKPQACPDVWLPVCGCDGTTYSNECEADAAGVSIEHHGTCPQVCGGFAGIECNEGEFCLLRDGECCCDFEGICVPYPDECPNVCDPVCGCDGQTWSNRCEAARAGVSVEHTGACTSGGGLVEGVVFGHPTRMRWEPTHAALGYNVYGRALSERPPQHYGRCLYSGLNAPAVQIPLVPAPGRLWILQVTALFRDGEGPMGQAAECRERKPIAPCRCTLPADVGPCDAVVPRWFHDWVEGKCTDFIWGGCGGNANNFETEAECEAVCEDACSLAADPGDCEAAIPRWFHDPVSGRCELFIWGGCGGNANNFETAEECEAQCRD